jgi:hypothetical protein
VQRLSHDCFTGAARLEQLATPRVIDGQRTGALRVAEPRATALLAALCQWRLRDGFTNRELRPAVAQLLGRSLDKYSPGAMTYDLSRLRLHGLIRRIPGRRRYSVTPEGIRIVYFVTQVHSRVLRTGLSAVLDDPAPGPSRAVTAALQQIQRGTDQLCNLTTAA